MTYTAKAVLKAAETWNHQKFASAGYGKSPYCASFVRWCFKQVNGTTLGLPLVTRVPYYVRKGIHVGPGEWFADSMAGDAVGPVVEKQQPGDLVFFHDTCFGPWPIGSITHIGIAADHGDMIADAGTGSVVHFRSHRATFPGKFVEVRRPHMFLEASAGSASRTALVINRGRAFGMVHGHHVRDLTVQIACLPGSAASPAATQRTHAESRFNQTMAQMMTNGMGGSSSSTARPPSNHGSGSAAAGGEATFHWEISANGQRIKPVKSLQVDVAFEGGRLKVFGHDHIARGYLNGAGVKGVIVKAELKNGAAHVWLDGKEIKPEHAQIEFSA